MKYFKYWSEDIHQINIGNHNEEINLLVGSNVSKDAAKDVSVQEQEILSNVLPIAALLKNMKPAYESLYLMCSTHRIS